MEKITIRPNIMSPFSARKIPSYGKSLKDIIHKKGIDFVLKELFCETESYSRLAEEYKRFACGMPSEEFVSIYRINDCFGVSLDANIYLFQFYTDEIILQSEVLDWCYVRSKKYVGDTWFYDDDEILEDIQKLSIVDFLDKYKGY